MANVNLGKAKTAKCDEFYTQWDDIETEMNAYLDFNPDVFRGKTVLCPCDDPEWSNFTKYFALRFSYFGMKKLISTSYAVESKNYKEVWQLTMFEKGSPKFDNKKTRTNGKIFILDGGDVNKDGKIKIDDLKWDYLEGDGDFRSAEVKALRDEADIIITNPPFSLFREFLAWIIEAKKQFLVIANMNAITYREVFPLIKENKLWLGNNYKVNGGAMFLEIPEGIANLDQVREIKTDAKGKKIYITRVQGVRWFTNLDHDRHHEPLMLMTMKQNLKYSKHKEIKGKKKYEKYDNYNAIEVPYVDAIPDDYEGIMGVPISFLDKYCPEQFEILGATQRGCHDEVPDNKKYDDYWEVKPDGTPTGSSGGKTNENANMLGNDGKKNYFINENRRIIQSVYQRIFIRRRNN
jgi:hypothetical protein